MTSYAKYAALSERLRALGPAEDATPDAPLCRCRRDDLIVDVMPVDEHVLAFSNRWDPAAIEAAQTLDIAGHNVRVVTPGLFVATKLEAFHGRGGGDIVASHDLEDIIAVVDGRPELLSEVAAASADVRRYIASELRALLDNPRLHRSTRFLPSPGRGESRAALAPRKPSSFADSCLNSFTRLVLCHDTWVKVDDLK